MAVTLKRDATGLCRCPDGSLAICADCDCTYTGSVDFYLDGIGPFILSYVGAPAETWSGTFGDSGAHPFPSIPSFGETSWSMHVVLRPYGDCLWAFSVELILFSGGVVGAAIYESRDGLTTLSYCWSGSYNLAHNPELGMGSGWPTALDVVTSAHIDEG